MTPPVKENIDAVVFGDGGERQAYVNCIDELKELKIYKSADEDIDEVKRSFGHSHCLDSESVPFSQLGAQTCLQPEYFAQYQSQGVYF